MRVGGQLARLLSVGAVATALIASGIPHGAGDPAGGTVTNLAPAAPTVSSSLGGSANTGSTTILSGQATDLNGEANLQAIRVAITGRVNATLNATATSLPTSEPASFDAQGFKVWNCSGARDGVICYKFQYTFPSAGTYGFAVSASDALGYGPASAALSVTVANAIQVGPGVVLANGTAAPDGSRWGSWSATPGAANVTASNYVKVVNTGMDPAQQFTIDFTGVSFAGVTDGSWSIAIDGNLQFACAQTQAGQAPEALSFSFQAASASGSATCSFTAGSANGVGTIYVQYRIAQVPAPMMGQSYVASYTVSA